MGRIYLHFLENIFGASCMEHKAQKENCNIYKYPLLQYVYQYNHLTAMSWKLRSYKMFQHISVLFAGFQNNDKMFVKLGFQGYVNKNVIDLNFSTSDQVLVCVQQSPKEQNTYFGSATKVS